MNVQFFNLSVNDKQIKDELLKSVENVLDHGRLILGPEVAKFERIIAKLTGVNFAIGVSSGSSALYLGLKSLNIKAGDEVITTPHSWVLTGNAILETGAVPVFTDVLEDGNMDPKKIESAITKNTKAILPVHFTGLMCRMDEICEISLKHNIPIVEDAAQAFGGAYKGGKAGSFGKVGAFSMNSMKVLGAFGEAGVVVTNDKEINDKIRILRYSGTNSDPNKIITNEAVYPSLNHKIDTVQAAMLLVMLKYLPKRMERRKEIANYYNSELSTLVNCPDINNNNIHALYTYAIQAEDRDQLMNYMNKNHIETKIYHTPLIPDSPSYKKYRSKNYSVAKKIISKTLSIPAHEKLTDNQVSYVVNIIKKFYGK